VLQRPRSTSFGFSRGVLARGPDLAGGGDGRRLGQDALGEGFGDEGVGGSNESDEHEGKSVITCSGVSGNHGLPATQLLHRVPSQRNPSAASSLGHVLDRTSSTARLGRAC